MKEEDNPAGIKKSFNNVLPLIKKCKVWICKSSCKLLSISGNQKKNDSNELDGDNSNIDLFVDKLNQATIDVYLAKILENTLAISTVSVSNLMIHRHDIVALKWDLNFDEIINHVHSSNSNYTRIPIYKNSLDDICGFIHVKDLLLYYNDEDKKDFSVSKVLRQILFVPSSMKAIDLLTQMRSSHIHIAVVIDDYSGTDGIITMENIIELMVGEIEDEHDSYDDNNDILKLAENLYSIDAKCEWSHVTEVLGLSFDHIHQISSVDSIGGVVNIIAGRLSEEGETIQDEVSKVKYIVRKADAKSLHRLVVLIPSSANAATNPA